MEYVGFLALLIFGGWMVFASVAGSLASFGFTGKVFIPFVIIGLVGFALVVTALYNAPFVITLASTKG